MAIELNRILPYGRDFRDQTETLWWYSRADEQVVSTEKLMQEYGFASVQQMMDCDFLVPLWRTDLLREERAFLRVQPRSPAVRRVEAAPDGLFDRAFRAYIEQARLVHDWRVWETNALRRDAEKWCRDNHIPWR